MLIGSVLLFSIERTSLFMICVVLLLYHQFIDRLQTTEFKSFPIKRKKPMLYHSSLTKIVLSVNQILLYNFHMASLILFDS